MLLGRNDIGFSSPRGVMSNAVGELILSGVPKSPDEINSEIEAVPLSDVTEAVEKYLGPDNFSYAYVVPKCTKIY